MAFINQNIDERYRGKTLMRNTESLDKNFRLELLLEIKITQPAWTFKIRFVASLGCLLMAASSPQVGAGDTAMLAAQGWPTADAGLSAVTGRLRGHTELRMYARATGFHF
ncbi:MAG: hypothetical protein IPG34_04210 [Rhodocyclaceae bacterium]|nr:hypothetical protein [Rhodocyclaceae bacterium]